MRRARYIAALGSILLLCACADPGPTLFVDDVQVVAPAPGRSATVAYMTVRNAGADEVLLMRVTSPDYGSAELHETRIEDNVARMRPLKNLAIQPDTEERLEPGGRHIMLLRPVRAFTPGSRVSLTLHFDSNSELVVEAPISASIAVK